MADGAFVCKTRTSARIGPSADPFERGGPQDLLWGARLAPLFDLPRGEKTIGPGETTISRRAKVTSRREKTTSRGERVTACGEQAIS
jgi:hypothetical protein